MNREEYECFIEELRKSEKVPVKNFEALKCFEACLPIEVLAERGLQTLAFGAMKPVGLEDPRTGKRPLRYLEKNHESASNICRIDPLRIQALSVSLILL